MFGMLAVCKHAEGDARLCCNVMPHETPPQSRLAGDTIPTSDII